MLNILIITKEDVSKLNILRLWIELFSFILVAFGIFADPMFMKFRPSINETVVGVLNGFLFGSLYSFVSLEWLKLKATISIHKANNECQSHIVSVRDKIYNYLCYLEV